MYLPSNRMSPTLPPEQVAKLRPASKLATNATTSSVMRKASENRLLVSLLRMLDSVLCIVEITSDAQWPILKRPQEHAPFTSRGG